MSGASNNGSCVSTTIVSLRRVQLTRSSIVAQLHRTNISDAIAGLYVRVLLELENGGEEYKIARILDVQQGAEYSGFTYDTMVTTDRYLVLELSPPAKIDNHYQLNSVSNKEFQHTEYQAWQRDVSLGRLSNPTDVELHTTLIEKIRMLGSGANIPSMASAGSLIPPNTPSSANAIQPRVQSNICLNNNDPSGSNPSIAVNGRQPTRSVFTPSGAAAPLSHHRNLNSAPHVANSSSTAVDEDSSESDYDQSDDELRRSAEEELREQHFVIPKELLVQSTQELRRLDRDVGEYIEKIRENLEQNSTKCIACMVHDPAVIILPCKHKVLCRGCCTKVLICPMCRKKIREVFEPVEM